MNRRKTLTEGNPITLIILFAIPVFFGNLFQIFYSLIDTKIVGSILGDIALASVGSVSTLYNLMNGFVNGLTLGFSIILARHYGSGDERLLKKTVAGTIVLGGAITAVLTIGILLFLHPILQYLNVPQEEFEMANGYISVLIVGLLITFAYNACANMLRAIGDTVTPLMFLVFAAILNVVLDYLFILVFHLGVRGAAIATVLAQLVSVILCIHRIWKKFPILHVGKGDFRLHKDLVSQMLQTGFSMGFMSSLVNMGTVVLQTGINTLGTSIIVAHTAARKVFEIWNLPVSVLGATMATYCSQNYGAQRYDRIRKGLRSVILLGACWSLCVFLMSRTIAKYLIGFIASSQNEDVIYWGTTYLAVDMSFHVICLLICVLRNAMQGFGDQVTPIFSSAIELVGKVVFACIFVKKFGYWGIIWAEPVIWIMMVIPLIVMTIKNPVMKKE